MYPWGIYSVSMLLLDLITMHYNAKITRWQTKMANGYGKIKQHPLLPFHRNKEDVQAGVYCIYDAFCCLVYEMAKCYCQTEMANWYGKIRCLWRISLPHFGKLKIWISPDSGGQKRFYVTRSTMRRGGGGEGGGGGGGKENRAGEMEVD